MYECLIRDCARYADCSLVQLERLKTANRKSGTVGDVDVLRDGRPVEAVEIKYDIPITTRHISDAIEKIKTQEVERYYVISTQGVDSACVDDIATTCQQFYASNGCELVTNGVFETLEYYLRLLGSTNDFLMRYVDHLADDDDLNFEHRIAWNEETAALLTD